MITVRKKISIGLYAAFLILVLAGYFLYRSLTPAIPVRAQAAPTREFEVKSGEGFFTIVNKLGQERLIRSPLALKSYLVITRNSKNLKPGKYEFNSQMSPFRIASILLSGPERDVKITIPEGSTIFDIDELLSEKKVFPKGDFIKFVSRQKEIMEGKFFPDTYHFYLNSSAEEAARKMLANFEEKAAPLLREKPGFNSNLILASLLEREIPDYEERRIAAGVLKKRVESDMLVQVDATICYMKKIEGKMCYPITQLDLEQDSLYNTYIYKGWPKGPISNPGLSAIKAALDPVKSEYWFYLSDPSTKKTIFSETLDTHRANRIKYLLNS